MLWNFAQQASNRIKLLPWVPFSMLGLGLARAWLWWILDQVCYSPSFSSLTEYEAHFYFDFGEIVGFFLVAALARRFSPFLRKATLLIPAMILTFAASIAVLVALANPFGFYIACITAIVGGFGYALLLLMWLELYGSLSTKDMVLAWSYAFVLGFAVRNALSSELFDFVAPLLPLISVVMLMKSYLTVPSEKLPLSMSVRPSVPKTTLLCLAAIAFAFGVGDVIAGQKMFDLSAQIGMAIPEIIVLLGLTFFAKRFDMNFLLIFAPLFITAGLGVAFFTDLREAPSSLFMYASSQTYLILSYAVGCAIARRLQCSAVFLCGIFAGVHKLFMQAGKQIAAYLTGDLGFDANIVSALGILTTLMVLIAAIVMVRDRNVVDRISVKRGSAAGSSRFDWLTSEYSLTPREVVLLPLISKGLNASEIGEELFLAPSTVRVHISNIYRKVNIHSRKELLALLEDR